MVSTFLLRQRGRLMDERQIAYQVAEHAYVRARECMILEESFGQSGDKGSSEGLSANSLPRPRTSLPFHRRGPTPSRCSKVIFSQLSVSWFFRQRASSWWLGVLSFLVWFCFLLLTPICSLQRDRSSRRRELSSRRCLITT
jgi:hypothetical protein